ncbi:hemolysin family protein [Oxalobacteraceae bacterium OTU3CINTB1]|nr:hemolysin family protein [Oxalobacteraceae bacterium OTU3CINTB1]
MEILILIGLSVLNGVFAMSEIALVTVRKARLKKLASEGDNAATTALELGGDPTDLMSTVQIGITSIGLLNGIVGEAVLAAPLAQWLRSLGLAAGTANIGATAAVVVVVTYISIVVGELVPKRLGQIAAEPVARLVARPMRILSMATRPFVALLSLSTRFLLRLMGVNQNAEPGVTPEEIHDVLEEGSAAGVIEQHEHEMLRNVFRLDARQLGSLMVPRADVVFIDINLPPDENLRRLIESEHTRFPVCEGGLDKILGVIHAKQALAAVAQGRAPDYTANRRPAIHVPETLTGMELLDQFRGNQAQMVFVIDEYGEVQGIVTLHDLLVAVTGEFTPRSADAAWAVRREDGSWLLDGSIPIPEMKDRLALKTAPEEDKARYHTLGGMMMLLLGEIPVPGDYAEWEGWRLEVVDMDDKRIDKVLAVPPAPAA